MTDAVTQSPRDRWSVRPPVAWRTFPASATGGRLLVRLVAPTTASLEAYEEAASFLREAGHDVLSPHELPGETTLAEAIEWLAASIYDADAVALLPGWQGSPRAVESVAFAESLGKAVLPVGAFAAAAA